MGLRNETVAYSADFAAVAGGVDGPRLTQSWRRCCERLRAELGDDIFNSWFGRIELEALAGGQARLSVPTRFLKSWIDTHYLGHITAALDAEFGALARILVVVRSSVRGEQSAPAAVCALPSAARLQASPASVAQEKASPVGRRASAHPAPGASADALVGSPLDRRLTFSTFQVGRSNQLAFTAAQRLAENLGGPSSSFCPLFIHSTVGLGKTHLLQAVAHTAAAQGRSAIYLTAEKFMYGFVAALQAQTSIAFKERLRAIDLLIFDDAQFLQGKSIQAEFGHALNALLDAGREVIVAADRPPNDLEALDERVRSRLGVGLCVEIGALDEPLRVKILEARIAAARAMQPNFELSPAVLAFVARSIRSNGRDLEGAVNRLLAHGTLTGAPLTVEAAEIAIRDLIRAHEPKRVKIEDIQKLVATHYSVSRADILSSRRTAVVVKPRQVAMFLAKTLTMRSLPEIGRRFGGRDHTTVLHAVRKIEALSHTDGALRDELELLKRMLQD
jgi:chromosomal replication initiator protein